MKIKVDNKIFEQFPDLNLGVVIIKGIDNTGDADEVLDLISQREKEIQESFDLETLSQQPKIEAWRKAYSSFGAKPKNYKCSVENLYRMVLEGKEPRSINKVVDIYNYISLKHMIPVGGDDIDEVEGDIILKFAEGSEQFRELNSEEIKSPKPGEVVYMDDKEVLCRRWNWRECDKSKMTEETKNVALVIEGLPPTSLQEVKEIIPELSEMVKKYCGGETTYHILNKNEVAVNI